MKTNKISEKQNKNGGEINMAENQSKKKFSTVFGSSSHSYPESERLQRKPNKRVFFHFAQTLSKGSFLFLSYLFISFVHYLFKLYSPFSFLFFSFLELTVIHILTCPVFFFFGIKEKKRSN